MTWASHLQISYVFTQVAQMVKNLPTNAGDMGREDSLEEEMATHSSIFAWRIPQTEGLGS